MPASRLATRAPLRAWLLSALVLIGVPSAAPALVLEPELFLAEAEIHRARGRYREADSLASVAMATMRWAPPRSESERLELLDGIAACARPSTAEGCDSVVTWARWAAERHDTERTGTKREMAWLSAAHAYRRAGRIDSASVCAERAVAALRAREGRTPAEESRLLASVAIHFMAADRSREADRFATEAIAAWDLASGADSLILATALVPRGRVRLERSEIEPARADLTLALGIRLRRTGPDHGDLVPVWRTIATLRGLSDDLPGAMSAMEEALRIAGLTRPPNDPELTQLHSQASAIASAGGDLVDAVRYGRLAVAGSERRFGRLSAPAASSKLSLANALSHLGDLASALEEGREAVEIQKQVLAPESGGRAYGLSTLGSIEMAAGHAAESYECYRESARIREALLGPDHMLTVYSLGGQAEAAERLNRAGEALVLQERVVRSQESRGLLKQLLESRTALARIQHRLGRDSLALETIGRAIAISDSIYGPGAAPAPNARLQRVPVLHAMGRDREAFDEALQLAVAEREHVWRAISAVSEREALAAAEVRSNALSAALELAAAHPLGEEALRGLWIELARARSLVFRHQAERRARRESRSPEEARGFARLDSARAGLGREILAAARAGSAARPARLDSLNRAVEEAERALARSARGLEPEHRAANLDAALAALRPGEYLISFARYGRMATDPAMGSGASDSAEAYLALIGRGGGNTIALVALGDARVLEERVERWNALIRRPASDPAGETALEGRAVEAGEAVRRGFWDPIARQVEGGSRVFLVGDGSAANIDFAALPRPGGGYLVESGPLLILLASERDLTARAHEGRGLLALGEPDFDAGLLLAEGRVVAATRVKDPDSLQVRFEPLPESGAEAREAVDAWEAASGDAPPSRLLLGDRATEEAFRRDAPARAMLHLATHGFMVGAGGATVGGGTRRGVGALAPAGSRRSIAGAVDWSVAGLALAGANRVAGGEPTQDDGLLTGAELAALDLSRVRCAVLSACRTGAVRADQLESIQGLERGLRLAGAGQVVMSLWPVEDADARAWMRVFYRAYLERHGGIAEAVRAADLERLRAIRVEGSRPRPHRWAPFFVRGERE